MMPDSPHYDQDCLQQLLDDALGELQTQEIAEHVNDCPTCRAQLELLAGKPQWWSQACEGVKAILADPAAYTSIHSESGLKIELTGSAASDASFAADFAVDFLSPSDNPEMLGRLGEYEIVEVIGQGGMGIVLKGYQKELHRFVAVKVLAPNLALSAAARRRFAREAQATAAIVNPHVMAIHSVNATARLPYLVMPFMACESLQQRIERQGTLDVKDVLRIGLQAAKGLAAAHAQGLVHRDVKPANILLETNVDRVMLTDFGLARAVDDATLTRTGIIAGTPQYMSPEQANGDAIDHRSDLFSLGGVLYAMCTARPPFRAETTFGVLRRIRETDPVPVREINSDVPEWLERIVLRLLSKERDNRFATASDVAALLEQCLAHLQQPTTIGLPRSVGDWTLLPGRRKRMADRTTFRRITVIACSLLLITAAATLGVAWRFHVPVPGEVVETPDMPSVPEALLQWETTQSELDSASAMIQQLETDAGQDLRKLAEERQD